ncbi:MAG TPA: hypothetical protein VFV90_01890 [Usitatibacter sp.]|nr:hypothetical protein [Usitatibacter sp.]
MRGAACVCLALLCTGCATVAQVTTLSEPSCRQAVERAFTATFKSQGESDEVSARLASSTTRGLQSWGLGPRPFLVAAPSGADYSFFIERKDDACLLRLYGRQKGFVTYTNNLTYIATEPLAPCRCAQ